MAIPCGKYKHFKGKEYTVFGETELANGEKCVLYRQEYGTYGFWIRPTKMFHDKVSYNGKEVDRFNLEKKIKLKDSLKNLVNIIKENSIVIKHSETEEKYRIIAVDEELQRIVLSLFENFSSYLTDSQLSYRMGYDMYKVNGKKVLNKTCLALSDEYKLEVLVPDEEEIEHQTKKIIEKQFNSCSIDLHISNEFYRPKLKEIDMANSMLYTTTASKLWKKISLHKINGMDGIVLLPNQTVVTYTYEKICLPSDCAGKVEIKSTYARLALSVTASDFCNPGWKGHFPLTIKNNGMHKIILHPKEKMLQLSLIPTKAPIINEYSKAGVFMDDDGTPFKFWQSQTVKQIVSETEKTNVMKFYKNVLTEIQKDSQDVESEKERFENTFLCYYVKKMRSSKYREIRNDKERMKVLWKKYKQKEETLKFFFCRPVKFSTFLICMVPILIQSAVELHANGKLTTSLIWGIAISLIVAIIVQIIMFFKTPKYYCTFERIDFENICK